MNCVEFQNGLSEVLEGQRTAAHEAHLASCAHCSALLEDLNEIVVQARDLPLAEPGPQVWTRLHASLLEEELVRESAPAPAPRWAWWPRLSWADAMGYAAVAVILVLAFGLVTYQASQQQPTGPSHIVQTQPAGRVDDDDLQLLKEVEARRPDAREAYESSLREINMQIADAERAVKENPADPQARQSLMEAHQQKSMVYEMALTRSVE